MTLGYNLILNNNDFLYMTFENPPYIFRKWETQIINIEFYKKIKNLELLFDLNYIIEKNLGWMDIYDNNPGDKKIGDFDNFALSLTIKQNL